MYHNLDKRISFMAIFFTSQRESNSFPDMDFFYCTSPYFVLIGVIEDSYKLSPLLFFPGLSILFLFAPAHEAWVLKSLSSSLMLLSAKFAILMS